MFPLKQIGYYCFSLSSAPLAKTYNSIVYVGTHMLTKKIVAIKEIVKQKKQQTHQEKLEVDLLINEIDTLFELQQCENMLHLIDVYQTEDHVYIITDYYKDGDLEMMLQSQRQKPLSEKQALQLIKKIYRNYYELYKRNILHRDLKLANVFMEGQDTILADFGYCIKYDPKINNGVVKSQDNVGSPLYMAPQIYSSNQYSVKSDIWAIGVIFFQLLTTENPWIQTTEQALFQKIKNEPIEKLIPQNLSQISKKILINSLQFYPQNRMNFQQLFSLTMLQENKPQSAKSDIETEFNENGESCTQIQKRQSQNSIKNTQCSTLENSLATQLPIEGRKRSACSLLI